MNTRQKEGKLFWFFCNNIKNMNIQHQNETEQNWYLVGIINNKSLQFVKYLKDFNY